MWRVILTFSICVVVFAGCSEDRTRHGTSIDYAARDAARDSIFASKVAIASSDTISDEFAVSLAYYPLVNPGCDCAHYGQYNAAVVAALASNRNVSDEAIEKIYSDRRFYDIANDAAASDIKRLFIDRGIGIDVAWGLCFHPFRVEIGRALCVNAGLTEAHRSELRWIVSNRMLGRCDQARY